MYMWSLPLTMTLKQGVWKFPSTHYLNEEEICVNYLQKRPVGPVKILHLKWTLTSWCVLDLETSDLQVVFKEVDICVNYFKN